MFHLDSPPAKRRRTTLADTLLSSALNVALISTAFGITAYRLWMGGSDEQDAHDTPPPYEQGDWNQPSYPRPPSSQTSSTKEPSSPKKRGQKQLRTHVVPRRRPAFIAPPRPTEPSPSKHHLYSAPVPDVGRVEGDGDDIDNQMDWMSAQLQHLIAEGRRALGKEIVVGSDVPTPEDEDLEDDGDEAWEAEDAVHSTPRARSRRSGSTRSSRKSSPAKRSQPLARPTSPVPLFFDSVPLPASRRSSLIPSALDGLYQAPQATQNREGSPDLQLAMERVRRAYGLNP